MLANHSRRELQPHDVTGNDQLLRSSTAHLPIDGQGPLGKLVRSVKLDDGFAQPDRSTASITSATPPKRRVTRTGLFIA